MRTAQPPLLTRRPRSFWPRHPVASAPAAPVLPAAGSLQYLPLGYAAVFLLGYLPGIWLGRTGSWEPGSQLAAYYLAKTSYASLGAVWGWQFSAAFLQLTALYFCSFSSLGCFFFLPLFLVRGGFLGLCAACVLAAGETHGLVSYWLLHCLPNLTVLFAGLWLSGYGAPLSAGLFQSIFSGSVARGQLSAAVRRLTVRFALCLFLAAVASLASSWLSVLLAGVLL